MSPQNQHLTQAMLRKPATTTPKQFQTTWCFGKDGQHAGGAGDLVSNGVPRDPAILLDLQKHCGASFGKRHCSNLIFGRKRSFLDSKKWSSQYDVNLPPSFLS
jgi:hypothetical protein